MRRLKASLDEAIVHNGSLAQNVNNNVIDEHTIRDLRSSNEELKVEAGTFQWRAANYDTVLQPNEEDAIVKGQLGQILSAYASMIASRDEQARRSTEEIREKDLSASQHVAARTRLETHADTMIRLLDEEDQ